MDVDVAKAANAAIDKLLAERNISSIDGWSIINLLVRDGIVLVRSAPTHEEAISANQIIPAAMLLTREDSVLETYAGAGDMVDDIGPPVVIAPYKAPKDPRVQQLLRDAEAVREAERAEPRQLFTDPRLDPNYKPPKKK
ncbi:hypothetical protein [Bradyrhizobium elkanii]|uniref:Uncharacterized protein n=1 Tax=Bradyrhizobium elkanii TaxID=29448 RepID=A0A8I1YE81_BRAEL|nr:hypothetical protein [Bradyrhizobium elkanii]MBP1296636.1 hypothetical protein [Bradyrhizobium elkanii]